jgi:hypothetical protein
MDELLQRILENLGARIDGPLHFRVILQPVMALVFATLDGLKDAKAGKPAYFWALATTPSHRKELLRDGWKSFGKIFILALVLDLIFQIKVLGTVYPGELVVVALVLAVIPYVLMRGPANRVASLFLRKKVGKG